MKHIRNWKSVLENLPLEAALNILQIQKLKGYEGPFAIKHNKTGKFIEQYKWDISFSPLEITNDWMVFIPDNDEEEKNEKIRNYLKGTNCTGLKHQKIDNMTIEEIWEHISNTMDKDKKYRMLLYYFENNIYKKN